jgi:hypothetical protein
MFVLPIERYQEACDAFTTFTRDVSQLTQQTWEEAGKRQFAFLRLGQDFGEQQLRVLGNGFTWNEQILEQSAMSVDFWRQAFSTWRELIDAFTETSDRLRASMDRIEPFWTPAAWEEMRENIAQAVDAARKEALEQIRNSPGCGLDRTAPQACKREKE